MSGRAALARAEAAGLRFRLTPHGRVQMEADAPPPFEVLADLGRYREDVASILADRVARASRDTDGAAEAVAMVAQAGGDCGRPFPEAEHRASLAGFLAAGQHRPPSWADPADVPTLGAWCGCCGRHQRSGGRWWCEAVPPKGWRCWPCHPPDGQPAAAVMEMRT